MQSHVNMPQPALCREGPSGTARSLALGRCLLHAVLGLLLSPWCLQVVASTALLRLRGLCG